MVFDLINWGGGGKGLRDGRRWALAGLGGMKDGNEVVGWAAACAWVGGMGWLNVGGEREVGRAVDLEACMWGNLSAAQGSHSAGTRLEHLNMLTWHSEHPPHSTSNPNLQPLRAVVPEPQHAHPPEQHVGHGVVEAEVGVGHQIHRDGDLAGGPRASSVGKGVGLEQLTTCREGALVTHARLKAEPKDWLVVVCLQPLVPRMGGLAALSLADCP